jgi:hypothetical protein
MYLVCDGHGEPVRSADESGQHYYDLPTIRFNWLRRDHWLPYVDRFPGTLGRDCDHLSYFERNTFTFLHEHRNCGTPCIVSEYGETFSIEAPTIASLLSEVADLPNPVCVCHHGQRTHDDTGCGAPGCACAAFEGVA